MGHSSLWHLGHRESRIIFYKTARFPKPFCIAIMYASLLSRLLWVNTVKCFWTADHPFDLGPSVTSVGSVRSVCLTLLD